MAYRSDLLDFWRFNTYRQIFLPLLTRLIYYLSFSLRRLCHYVFFQISFSTCLKLIAKTYCSFVCGSALVWWKGNTLLNLFDWFFGAFSVIIVAEIFWDFREIFPLDHVMLASNECDLLILFKVYLADFDTCYSSKNLSQYDL